uniref:Uncharacterized protein n=1 Tax=Kalanchoe fedtschenkoi TaxID=63787 RepID=A0A7N0VE37_KALFE
MLEDEVWRLEKIGKGGAFEKKLASEGINTVQDFLRLYVTNQTELRKILGVNMSDKMWNVTINHAEECLMSNKRYVYRSPHCSITFNPIFQIIDALIDGKLYSAHDLHGHNKAYVEKLAKEAYQNQDSLEVVEVGLVNSSSLLLTQGHCHHPTYPMSNHQTADMIVRRPQQYRLADTLYESSNLFDSRKVVAHMDTISNNWIYDYGSSFFMNETLIVNSDSSQAEEDSILSNDYSCSKI